MAKLLNELTLTLFSINQIFIEDFEKALSIAAETGYDAVEFGPTEGMTGEQIAEALKKYNLGVSALAFPYDKLVNEPDRVIDIATKAGTKAITCPWGNADSLASARQIADGLNSVVDKYADAGLSLGYHNHAHEFTVEDGKCVYDEMFELFDPRIFCQIDCHWVVRAGMDLDAVLKKYAGRIAQLHLKDFRTNPENPFTDMGTGVIDFAHVVALAKENGTTVFTFEQDYSENPVASVKIAYEYLMNMEEKKSMKKKLRYGIIGLGGISPKHLGGYSALADEVEIVAGCDIDEEKLQAQCDKYNIPRRYTDYHELLDQPDIDFVSVCLPNNLHASVTVEALKKGKHVHCEKPMAMNEEQTAAMLAARNETGLQLMVGVNNRFTPQSQYVKYLAETGVFGEIYFAKCGWQRRNGLAHAGWFLDKEISGGGPLIDLGVHFLDLVLYFMDYPEPDAILAKTYTKFGNNEKRVVYTQPRAKLSDITGECTVEDLATGFITLKNGASVQFEMSWASNNQDRIFYDLYGTEGGVHWESGPHGEIFQIFNVIGNQMVISEPKGGINMNLLGDNEFEHFVRCMRENVHPTISIPEQTAETIRIIRGIYESAETGRHVTF